VIGLQRVPRETRAWTCLGANALVLPGLGSLLVGRVVVGVLQAAMSLVGFALSSYWILSWSRQVLRDGTIPEDLGPYEQQGLGGLLLFVVGWVWAVFTGIAELRSAKRAPKR
jgi:hypothetical protein